MKHHEVLCPTSSIVVLYIPFVCLRCGGMLFHIRLSFLWQNINMIGLENFTLVAKNQAAFDAFIHLKVEDNSTAEVGKAVREDLKKLRTSHMEFDIGSRKGRLHACFARMFGLEVAPYVILRDPNRDEIEVAVEKKNGKVFFLRMVGQD